MKQSKTFQKSQVLQKSEQTILLYKALGQTPLEAIKELGITEKVGYAGRLDPMAEGLLLLLVGDENKKKHDYERLSKTYEFECLFGIETDSLDVLGLITHVVTSAQSVICRDALEKKLSAFEGNVNLPYPIYSSKRVNGKPLFYWARQNKLDQIVIPSKKVNISKLTLNSLNKHTGEEVFENAMEKVGLVKGDFRQNEISKSWKSFLENYSESEFLVAHITASVSSGTYIRSLCKEIGKSFSLPAMALSIKRTKLGNWTDPR